MTSQSLPVEASSNPTSIVSRLLATQPTLAPFVLRATLAVVMFPHGAQKVLGWFGGAGWSQTMDFFTGHMGMPSFAAAGVILLEFFGPLLLLAGLGTRAVALGFAGLMVGAIATVHGSEGFFMNWTGKQPGEGYEYHLLVIGMSLALTFAGAGRWSLDRKLGN